MLKKDDLIGKRANISQRSISLDKDRAQGMVKKRQIIHILWISVLPPPLSTSTKFSNIHTKEFFIDIRGHPPCPFPLFCYQKSINFFYFLLLNVFFLLIVIARYMLISNTYFTKKEPKKNAKSG